MHRHCWRGSAVFEFTTAKAFYTKQEKLEADIGKKYGSFRAIEIEGVEQK